VDEEVTGIEKIVRKNEHLKGKIAQLELVNKTLNSQWREVIHKNNHLENEMKTVKKDLRDESDVFTLSQEKRIKEIVEQAINDARRDIEEWR